MSDFLLIGTVLGALIGLAHATQIYRNRRTAGRCGPLKAAWFALWTLALWALFGSYLLAFWILGAAAMALAGMTGPRGTAP